MVGFEVHQDFFCKVSGINSIAMFTSKSREESSIAVDSGHNPEKKWQNLTNLSNEFGILMKINGGDDTGHRVQNH